MPELEGVDVVARPEQFGQLRFDPDPVVGMDELRGARRPTRSSGSAAQKGPGWRDPGVEDDAGGTEDEGGVGRRFWTRDRKRSSLVRSEDSASSFCSLVAPAMRMTKMRTNAPMTPRVSALARSRNEGTQPCQMPSCPTATPTRLQKAAIRHVREPLVAMFSRATKA